MPCHTGNRQRKKRTRQRQSAWVGQMKKSLLLSMASISNSRHLSTNKAESIGFLSRSWMINPKRDMQSRGKITLVTSFPQRWRRFDSFEIINRLDVTTRDGLRRTSDRRIGSNWEAHSSTRGDRQARLLPMQRYAWYAPGRGKEDIDEKWAWQRLECIYDE